MRPPVRKENAARTGVGQHSDPMRLDPSAGGAPGQPTGVKRAVQAPGPQARWLCCSLLTYHLGYSSSLASRQRAWGPAAKCQVILARALKMPPSFASPTRASPQTMRCTSPDPRSARPKPASILPLVIFPIGIMRNGACLGSDTLLPGSSQSVLPPPHCISATSWQSLSLNHCTNII